MRLVDVRDGPVEGDIVITDVISLRHRITKGISKDVVIANKPVFFVAFILIKFYFVLRSDYQ